jgi:membrane-associated phospholipid phosphatase
MIPERLSWRLLLWSVVAASACLAGFVVTYLATVRTVLGRQLSDAAFRGGLLGQSRTSDVVDTVLGVVSVASLLLAVAVIAFVALVRLQRTLGITAIALLVTSNLSTQLLKRVLDRPDLGLLEYTPATLNSLPSGHTTAAFSVVAALLLVVPRGLHTLVATVGGVYAALTAVATMFAGWHRWADSVAAFLLVGFWTVVALSVLAAVEGPPNRPVRRDWSVRRWWAWSSAVCLAGGLALLAPLAASGRLRVSPLGQVGAFGAGVAFIVATVIGVLLLVLEAIDRLVGEHAPDVPSDLAPPA